MTIQLRRITAGPRPELQPGVEVLVSKPKRCADGGQLFYAPRRGVYVKTLRNNRELCAVQLEGRRKAEVVARIYVSPISEGSDQ